MPYIIDLNERGVNCMNLNEFFDLMERKEPIRKGTELSLFMNAVSRETQKITAKLNNGEYDIDRIHGIFSEITGTPVDESLGIHLPFNTDFGKNIRLGKNVFINSGCCFQDQGGITIGDNALIGHNVVIATLNHDFAPERRADLLPAPVVIGNGVWIGSGSVILPGVTIGENAVIGAGSVVTRDVEANTVAAGNPTRKIKEIPRT